MKKVVLHPKCSGYDYQFACVQIDGHFDWSYYVKAIKLPDKEPKANTKMVVAGWGSRVNVSIFEQITFRANIMISVSWGG